MNDSSSLNFLTANSNPLNGVAAAKWLMLKRTQDCDLISSAPDVERKKVGWNNFLKESEKFLI
ncbi:hypothetical protein RchiOBHm_Chr6g0289531 [Rosa chinensis]|uniref:Uncharacterized protein n=1 Tax=Rosa chinensis TaxID=74649 RepID=A0A2P6PVL4_ROSCH|nr:hypothetical protein RchiOBHm_Chr6g0289531 [Rosa chinensis]